MVDEQAVPELRHDHARGPRVPGVRQGPADELGPLGAREQSPLAGVHRDPRVHDVEQVGGAQQHVEVAEGQGVEAAGTHARPHRWSHDRTVATHTVVSP